MSDPAFPSKALGGIGYTTGMTLRDYFAAKAMMAILTHGYPITREPDADHGIARAAYIQADSMLKARAAQ